MTVRVYRSEDFGSPNLDPVKGSLIGLLDACLINGYGDQTISITRDGNIATVTTPSPHGFNQWARYDISGAVEPEYNGTHDISVIGNNSFTFEISGTPVSPATGTISGRLGGSGWTSPYTATNKAVYAMAGSNTMLLDINDDVYDEIANIQGYETMDGLSSGTGVWGVTAFHKADNIANRPWVIVASGNTFYYWANVNNNSSHASFHHYGLFESNKAGDIYNVYLVGTISTSTVAYSSSRGMDRSDSIATNSPEWFIPRSYLQLYPGRGCSAGVGVGSGMVFPSKYDGSLYMADMYLGSDSRLMGKLYGLKHVLNVPTFDSGNIIHGSGELAGKVYIYLTGYSSKSIYIDLSDTW